MFLQYTSPYGVTAQITVIGMLVIVYCPKYVYCRQVLLLVRFHVG